MAVSVIQSSMNTEPTPASPDEAKPIADQELVAEVCRGNREMFEVLVRRYNERLFRTGMAYLGGHEQVEDAMQNAYVKAFVHLGQFHGTAAFSTWLTRIMINECLEILRKGKTTRDKLASYDLETDLAPGEEDH